MNIRSFNYIDAHAHLQLEQFARVEDTLIQQLKQKQIGVINVATNKETSTQAVEIAEAFPHMWATVGVHPHHTDQAFQVSVFKKLAKKDSVVGIGECGLDYFGDVDDTQAQKQLFEQQIIFAAEHELPLMIHCRPSQDSEDAYEDTIALLKKHKSDYGQQLCGNIHFFVGSWEIAKQFLSLDFTLSFTGIITHDSSVDTVIRKVPADSYLIETDAPYAAPKPHRGKRNSPEYIPFIARRIAEIRNLTEEQVQEQTTANTARLFSLY